MNEGETVERGNSLRGSSVRRTWRENSFTGDPGGCAKKGSGNGRLFPYRPHFWGTWREVFLGSLRE